MQRVIFSRGNFVVMMTGNYITIINKKPPGNLKKSIKRDFHCHLNKEEEKAARGIVIWAHKIQDHNITEWPDYPDFMMERLCRLLYGKREYLWPKRN